MSSNTNPFREYANSRREPQEPSKASSTTDVTKSEQVMHHKVLPSPFSIPATSSTDIKSTKSFPEHLPQRITSRSFWARLWSKNKCRIAVGVFCFLIIVGGTIVGAFFLANVMRTGRFHPASGASMRNATRTVQVTTTSVVAGLGKEMGPMTETIWSMQETHVLTQWVVVVSKTTTMSASPTKPTTKS